MKNSSKEVCSENSVAFPTWLLVERKMSAMEVDPQEEEVEVPSSSTSKQDKKRFEVKKVTTQGIGETLLGLRIFPPWQIFFEIYFLF